MTIADFTLRHWTLSAVIDRRYSSSLRIGAFATDVDRMRLRETKPVCDLTIIFAVEDCEIAQLPRLEGADFVAAPEAVSCVNRCCGDALRRRHFHLRRSERKHHRD